MTGADFSAHHTKKLGAVTDRILRLVNLATWAWYLAFMIIPVIDQSDNSRYFNFVDNLIYLLIGLTLCFATTFAAQQRRLIRAIVFASDIIFLSYWF